MTGKTIINLLATSLFLITQSGQAMAATQTDSGDGFRKVAPKAPAPRPFSLPKIDTFKLANGLTVEMVEDHRFPFITTSIGFQKGSTTVPNELIGLGSLTADLMTEGTTSKSSKEIAQAVDFIGGSVTAGSDFDYTTLSASGLSAYSDKLLDLMSDVLLHPSFPQDEITLLKTNLIQELTIKRSQPDFLIAERFSKVVFGTHPYSVVSADEDSINRITQKDIVAYHDRTYIPNNAIMVVVGDFDSAKLKEKITKNFGEEWKPGTLETVTLPAMPTQSGRKIYLVDRPGSVQTSIKIGNVGIQRKNPDYFALMVMNQILGGSANSRLFMNIREQKGFTYGAYSGLTARRDKGSFAASANVRTEVTGPSVQEFLYELERMRNTKVSDSEIGSARSYLAGSFQLGLETQSGLAQRLLEVKLYDLPEDYLSTYADKVMAVNVDDLRTAARKVIDADNLVITAVGDAKKIRSDLEMFAPVTVFDMQGKLAPGGVSN
jgi:zinc protease